MSSILRNKVPVKIKRLSEDAVIPRYAHASDAGFDLVAIEDTVIAPGETKLIKTGIAVAIPEGYELSIRPRSGITVKTKLRVAYGTVDSGYVGELGVMVDNIAINTAERRSVDVDRSYPLLHVDGTASKLSVFNNNAIYKIRKGDRIAQAIISEAPTAIFTEVDSLDETERGSGGFGSTGVKEAE